MVQRPEVFSFQHVDAVDANAPKFSRQILLCALKPVGDVFRIGHGGCAGNDVHAGGHQNGEVVAAGGKTQQEACLCCAAGEMFFL